MTPLDELSTISPDELKKEPDMLRSLFTAATGMTAQQQHIDVISNNLANVNTTGFKRGRADFQDLLYQTLRQPGAASSEQTEIPTGIQLGLGVRTAAVQRLFLRRRLSADAESARYRHRWRRVFPNSAARWGNIL